MKNYDALFDLAVRKIRACELEALDIIREHLAFCAKKQGITKMEFLYTTKFYRGEKEVECPELSAIEDRFLEEVHPQGFMVVWTKENGWQ